MKREVWRFGLNSSVSVGVGVGASMAVSSFEETM